jgi:hypothetical protein
MTNVEDFGIYKMGMTREEIRDYLITRYNEKTVKNQKSKYINPARLMIKFAIIAGANTQAAVQCPGCKKMVSLMYRYDVERFSDQLFDGTKTYFD